jgi:hypothetical protein
MAFGSAEARCDEEDLRFLRAESKNRERENGRQSGNATLKAIDHLHRNKMIVVGGLIVGSPGDTRAYQG